MAKPWSRRTKPWRSKDDLTVKTDDQLSTQLGELKREQFNLRFQSATNQLEKPSRVKEVRRTIARIKTIQTARSALPTNPPSLRAMPRRPRRKGV